MGISNIVLIGMPGSGKSTSGVLLAKTLGMTFIDTDILIQQNMGQLLQSILNDIGTQRFLKIEEEVLLSLKTKNAVIAPGGSAVYCEEAIRHLKQNSCFFYLKLSYLELEKRIDNMQSRGIVIEKEQKFSDLYRERIPLYEKVANFTIECDQKNIEWIVSEIVKNYQTYKKIHLKL